MNNILTYITLAGMGLSVVSNVCSFAANYLPPDHKYDWVKKTCAVVNVLALNLRGIQK
jgi:hypothetical protein